MLLTLRPLKRYRDEINLRLLAPEIRRAWRQVQASPHWEALRDLLRDHAFSGLRADSLALDVDAITTTLPDSADISHLTDICRKLTPWRVGPYQLGSLIIDSEWRSHVKWERIAPLLGNLSGKRIADIGASNGYFLFKLLQGDPELALGFDPIDRCWLQFSVLLQLIDDPRLGFVPTGLATLEAFPEFFDYVLCMGVLYHQRDPFLACKRLYQSVRPGGRVLLESLTINEPGSHFLVPKERYAKMRNAWIVPTPEALESLLLRAGFTDTTIHRFGPIATSEQRRTEWAPYESLADFLDPKDSSRTIEGYPAPHSAAVVATKPGAAIA
jgi:tRNA (mo5U34)-methyltransferase